MLKVADQLINITTDDISLGGISFKADTGLTPIYDDITVSATKDMLQAITVQNKTPQEGLKILAEAAAKAKEKFKK